MQCSHILHNFIPAWPFSYTTTGQLSLGPTQPYPAHHTYTFPHNPSSLKSATHSRLDLTSLDLLNLETPTAFLPYPLFSRDANPTPPITLLYANTAQQLPSPCCCSHASTSTSSSTPVSSHIIYIIGTE